MSRDRAAVHKAIHKGPYSRAGKSDGAMGKRKVIDLGQAGEIPIRPGALHRELGIPEGQKIPAAVLAKAAHAKGKLGRRARLAETLKGMNR